MKAIASADLKLLLDRLPAPTLFSDQVDILFDEYGDDWFIEGGRWVKTKENEKMKKLREEVSK